MLPIALAQLRPRKGRYAENLDRLGAMLRDAAALPEPPRLVIAPESALTGYFLEGGVRDLAVEAEQLFEDLGRVHREAGAPPLEIALGFYERFRNHIYNSAMYASLGGSDAAIRHVHRKVFLPTYGVFDEERFVSAGDRIEAFDTRWGRAAMLICEDMWHSVAPAIAALQGAEVIIVPSASPARGLRPPSGDGDKPASIERWERIAQDIAGEHGVFVTLAQLVGFEGGKAFVGGSLVTGPRGDLLAEGPVFDEALVTATLDLDDIARVRAEMPLLADLQTRMPVLVAQLRDAGSERTEKSEITEKTDTGSEKAERTERTERAEDQPRPSSRPRRSVLTVASTLSDDPLAIDAPLAERWLVEFLRDELIRRRGFEKAIIGLSGGVDSALVAYLAARALGPSNVIGVRMPYRTSSQESLDHAQLVIDDQRVALAAAGGGQQDGGVDQRVLVDQVEQVLEQPRIGALVDRRADDQRIGRSDFGNEVLQILRGPARVEGRTKRRVDLGQVVDRDISRHPSGCGKHDGLYQVARPRRLGR